MSSSQKRVEIRERDLSQRRRGRDPASFANIIRAQSIDWEGFTHFGNNAQEDKAPTDFRIGMANVNTFPTYRRSPKFQDLKIHLLEHNYSVMGFCENNKYWTMHPADSRPWSLFKGIWETVHKNFNNNTTDLTPARNQPGGTGIISMNDGAHRVIGQGHDPTNLGRWTWNMYRGKTGHGLAILMAYRPCKPTDTDRTVSGNSTYRQHKSYFSKKHRLDEPRQAILDDMKIQLKEWYNSRVQIVVMMDANEDIRLPIFRKFFDQFDMKEAILSRHPTKPAVFTRTPGSQCIDGIWVSRSLEITKAGYTAFHPSPSFDHRFGWIDITMESAFGHIMPPIQSYPTRRLKLHDPKVRRKYHSTLTKHFTKHRLQERTYRLRRSVRSNQPLRPHQAREANSIDQLRTEGMIFAESTCRKLHTGETPWSVFLQSLRDTESFWTALFRVTIMGRKIGRDQILLRAKKCNHSGDIFTLPISIIKDKKKLAQQQRYKFEATEASAKRQEFNELLAQRRAAEHNSTAVKQLKQIMTREAQKDTWKRISWATKKVYRAALTRVDGYDARGNIQTYTDKKDIEQACQDDCINRLLQTQPTPFLQAPLCHHFSTFEDNQHVEALLAGTYTPPPGTDPHAAILLKYFKQDAKVRLRGPISNTWTVDEYSRSWKCKRESTSSGDSRLHFGHFKAVVDDHHIMSIHTELANICTMSGHSLPRWLRSLDVMIPKKIDSLFADKLRLINLMEPCFNHHNGLHSRRVMYRAEQDQQIALEQYGSRKHHSAINHALNKVLTFDYMRLLRRPGTLCANDAKSCYDRIVLMVAYLALRRLGMQPAAIASMFNTIQHMEHFTRTAFGTSESSYGGENWDSLPNGILQGNAFGPTVWAVTSTPILDMMRNEGHGILCVSPCSGDEFLISGFAFVDDADLSELAGPNDTTTDLLIKAQAGLDLWEGGIWTTGGAIVPEKSDWVLIEFEWKNGIWKYKPLSHRNKLFVTGADRSRAPLRQLAVTEGRLTLGVHIAPDGNWADQETYLRNKSKDWAEHIRSGHIQRDDVWKSYTHCITKSFEYCLPATYMSQQQLNRIYSPAMNRGLAASGIIRTIDRSICYGNVKYQGLGLRNPFFIQGIEHIKVLLNHGDQPTPTGKLLRANIELTKLEIGVGGDLFSYSFDKYGFMATKGWVKQTWQFLWNSNISIKEQTSNPPLMRVNDSFIIEDMIATKQLDSHVLRSVQRCLTFLDAKTLSDIVDASGTGLRHDSYNGHKSLQRFSRYSIYPTCPQPSTTDWNNWKRALGITYNLFHLTDPLHRPLQHWIHDDTLWIWFYEATEDRLYERLDPNSPLFATYSVHLTSRRSRRRNNRPFMRLNQEVDILPSTARPASVHKIRPTSLSVHLDSFFISDSTLSPFLSTSPTSSITPLTLHALIQTLDPSLKWALDTCTLPEDDGLAIAQLIRDGVAIGISDGSFKHTYGTAAFILHHRLQNCSFLGMLPCLGHFETHDAYRSELSGLLALVIALQLLCSLHNLQSGSVVIGCDNDTALDRCFDLDWYIDTSAENWDIIKAVRHITATLPITIIMQRVEGHRDNEVPWEDLNLFEQLNVQCDSMAKLYWQDTSTSTTPVIVPQLPGEGWSVHIQGTKIVQHLDDTLHDYCSTPPILNTWRTKRDIDPVTATEINWPALGKAMARVPRSRRIFVTKHVSDTAATGKNMRKRKERDYDHCPRCKLPHEDKLHVLRCPADTAQLKWDTAMETLHASMTKLLCPRDLPDAIIEHLHFWRDGSDHHFVDPLIWTPLTTSILHAQNDTGWDLLLDGCCSHAWEEAMDLYLRSIDSTNTGLRWTSALIRKMWDTSWDMWDHRNEFLHGKHLDKQLLGLDIIDASIRMEYEHGRTPLMTSDERSLFNLSLDNILTLEPQRRRAWLDKVESARELCILRDDSFMTQERASMARWLTQNESNKELH